MKDRGICAVCSQTVAKYSCPHCNQNYCSLSCYKDHKANDSCRSAKDDGLEDLVKRHTVTNPVERCSSPKLDYGGDGEDFVAFERLCELESSEAMGEMLSNPELCYKISELTKVANPEKLLKQFMKDELFVQFSNECLRIVDS